MTQPTHEKVRRAIAQAQTVVVKVGSSSLTMPSGHLDPAKLDALVSALACARVQGARIVLVSSGAIAAGFGPLGFEQRPSDIATQQACASVGQGLLMARYEVSFSRFGIRVGQILITAEDTIRVTQYHNAQRTLDRLLDLGVVPIVNENDTVATNELRFGDNDKLAALTAHVVGADALVLLSDVDALYSDHPSRPGARRITDVAEVDDLDVDTSHAGSHVGTGGMTTKVEAARIATHAGVDVVLASARHVAEALAGQPVGTFFHASGRRRSRKMLWLAYAAEAAGVLTLDEGAVRAVTERKASLLPAGVTSFTGAFHAGDPVRIDGPDGALVGHGLVNYDAADLPSMLGRSTRALAAERGEGFDRELVHRDALILRKKFRG